MTNDNYIRTLKFMMAITVIAGLFGIFKLCGRSIGLVKPKFKAGQCVREPYKNEFDTTYLYYAILKVGKEEYQTVFYDEKDGTLIGEPSVSYVDHVDREDELTNCPEEFHKF